jgi:hypothetical protein
MQSADASRPESASTIETRVILSTMHRHAAISVGLFTLLFLSAPASAWWGDGHALLSRAAVLAQPQEVPAFFREAGDHVAHISYDPDIAKNRAAPHLYDAEFPEHFVDLELLGGAEIPAKRHDFIALCDSLGVDPDKVGYAAHAIAEYTERLTVAFAEHRAWPENEMIRWKILVYAGFLAHYAEDLAQPLHATIHYDGRVVAGDGDKPHRGIHEKVDSLVERLDMDPADLARRVSVAPIDGDLFAAVRNQVYESNGRVDRVYELVDGLGDDISTEARAFADERARRAVTFTANLFLTAWVESEQVRLPGWLER